MVAIVAALGIGGGGLTGGLTQLMDLGGLKEKVESCQRQNTKQWEKINELELKVRSLEGK